MTVHAEDRDPLEEVDELRREIDELRREARRLKASDRKFQARLQEQQRWSLIFAGVVAFGAFFSSDGLSPENRASIEDVAVGIAVMLAGGIGVAGTTSGRFTVVRKPENEDEG